MTDSTFSSVRDYPMGEAREGGGILRGQGSKEEVPILRRRLALAQDEVKRLNEALAIARNEGTTKEQESRNRLLKLEEELGILRQSLQGKEQELDQSARARKHLEEELSDRNNELCELARRSQQSQTKLENKVEILEDLERKQKALIEQLVELPPEQGDSCHEQASFGLPRSTGYSFLKKIPKPVRFLPLIGSLLAVMSMVGPWSRQAWTTSSDGLEKSLAASAPKSADQRVSSSNGQPPRFRSYVSKKTG